MSEPRDEAVEQVALDIVNDIDRICDFYPNERGMLFIERKRLLPYMLEKLATFKQARAALSTHYVTGLEREVERLQALVPPVEPGTISASARPDAPHLAADGEAVAALVTRLQAVEAGSRELDFDIWDALHPESTVDRSDVFDLESAQTFQFDVPAFTRSLDAAFALAPDGWHLDLSGSFGTEWDCIIREPRVPWRIFRTCEFVGKPTAALALCIAALRARATRDAPAASPEGADRAENGSEPT